MGLEICGLPQQLTGDELVTVWQKQGDNFAQCTMPLAMLFPLALSAVAASLPTQKPATAGQLWNDCGVVAIS